MLTQPGWILLLVQAHPIYSRRLQLHPTGCWIVACIKTIEDAQQIDNSPNLGIIYYFWSSRRGSIDEFTEFPINIQNYLLHLIRKSRNSLPGVIQYWLIILGRGPLPTLFLRWMLWTRDRSILIAWLNCKKNGEHAFFNGQSLLNKLNAVAQRTFNFEAWTKVSHPNRSRCCCKSIKQYMLQIYYTYTVYSIS